ncbi:MAG: adenylate/guanylate cyclase domain-containing protein [Desulfobulbaceae bacterium]|nr:adenylate/guanylate cyclase domain-containing protein [Desulfobulbaceae bacterium]
MQFPGEDKVQNEKLKKHLRQPLFFRLSIAILLLFSLSIGLPVSFMMVKQRDVLFAEILKSAEAVVGYFAASAKVPLLADDTLRLNAVARDAAGLDGVVYAFVVDRNRIIQAHSMQEMLGREYTSFANEVVVRKNKESVIVQYQDNEGRQIFDLSRTVFYNDKPLGVVHFGIALDFISRSVSSRQTSVLLALLAPCLFILAALYGLAFFFAQRIRAGIAALIDAASEYGKGNLRHRIDKIDNDELGDVALALKKMAENLLARGNNHVQLENYLKFSSVDRILEGPVSKGEAYAVRRQVAVLFAGVKGFGSYAGTAKPEDVVTALNKYIEIVTRIISKHGGYVDKIIGDAVVGIFGVSLYREEHTARALRAAVELQETLSAGSERESRLLSNVCVGISAGIVLSGNIGSHSKVEYSSIGESIKEAYWLIGQGEPGEIILAEGIYNQIKGQVIVEQLDSQQVIGSSEAIKTYRFLNLQDKNADQ